ncbi:hypothetical protein XaraCFBP7407_19650 [Xanthomonas arboricola pv. arracaciae]|uniref:hypothetical protein n=1 Tax=Xanthomonas arboricola TaxID=56448 RepID=UPI000CEECD3D|nr:hypothetical protein [Xanthomonas arboricola]PPT92590.1 hypothetical protein XaraCFBP7407_19650 [Xanthomonas arboricola pv. arracaciae]
MKIDKPAVIIFSIIIAVFLPGCTFAVRAPKMAFNKVVKLEGDGYEVESAFNTTVVRWPGVTWSISGTYLPLGDGTSTASRDVFKYSYAKSSSFRLHVRGADGCGPSKVAEEKTTRALDNVFARIGGWPARGETTLTLVETAKPVQRYAFSARFGKAFHLDYLVPCTPSNTEDSLWVALMVAMHESTHATLSVLGQTPKDAERSERIAEGAEACLLIELSNDTVALLSTHPRAALRMAGRDESITQYKDIQALCLTWGEHMSDVIRQRNKR